MKSLFFKTLMITSLFVTLSFALKTQAEGDKKVWATVNGQPITDEELAQAKTKITSRVVRSSERPMGRMNSIAGAWMYRGEYSDPDVEIAWPIREPILSEKDAKLPLLRQIPPEQLPE